jgi:hypothetical protein
MGDATPHAEWLQQQQLYDSLRSLPAMQRWPLQVVSVAAGVCGGWLCLQLGGECQACECQACQLRGAAGRRGQPRHSQRLLLRLLLPRGLLIYGD